MPLRPKWPMYQVFMQQPQKNTDVVSLDRQVSTRPTCTIAQQEFRKRTLFVLCPLHQTDASYTHSPFPALHVHCQRVYKATVESLSLTASYSSDN